MKEIGGYFGLETTSGEPPCSEAIHLNSARSCLEYLLRALNIKHLYVPKFTCDVLLEPLKKLAIPYTFYRIKQNLDIAESVLLKDGEYLLYTNYFGITGEHAHRLAKMYGGRLILDYSQAFFSPAIEGCHTFYSPRKFFGIPDGGCLISKARLAGSLTLDTTSHTRFSHLLKRIELGSEAGYKDFKLNDASLSHQPMMRMSRLTSALLESIDFERVRKKRNENFWALHEHLGVSNELEISTEKIDAPMVYPYLINRKELRQHLIDQKIYVATYWPNVFDWSKPDDAEYQLAENVLPLPIDQRYSASEMQLIIDLIKRFY